MDNRLSSPLSCRYCQHYQIQGRRGGYCDKLGASVKGTWKSCSLMRLSFSSGRPTPKSFDITVRSGEYISDIHPYETIPLLNSPLRLKRSNRSQSFNVS